MPEKKRVLTIDIMRGITLFLMLFVNDLYSPGVPQWLTHRAADFDGMGLADWVFPGFLFMVGMSIPYAIESRIKKGNTTRDILFHIVIRTGSLLVIGILMLNVTRLNPDLTGMNKNLWAILIYVCIFLIWNEYGKLNSKYKYIFKGVGLLGILYLIIIFKSGTYEETSWLKTGWWGILGLIGWGYFVSAAIYLITRDSLIKTAFFWLFFIALNIFSQLKLLDFLNFLKPVFGVIISGNVPSIVLAGLFFSLILRKTGFTRLKEFIAIGTILGIALIITGFVLRNWFIISKIMGTPSWAMLCNGFSVLLFVVVFFIIDVLGKKKWTHVFKPAGQNSLTTYLAPDILYYSIWMSGFPILYYKQSEYAIVIIIGSIIWALLMIGFAALLSKIGIRLKL